MTAQREIALSEAAVWQVLDKQAQSGQVNVAAVVTESAVAAARGPSKLLLPLTAVAYNIRVIVLALEIGVRREFTNARFASAHRLRAL